MAGDWIKMRTDLYGDPAVVGIARRTGLNRFEVIGRLHAVWSWADKHLRDGNAVGVTPADLDEEAKHPGFAQAMHEERWLKILSTGIVFPDFSRHNGKPAKERALTSKRVKRHRNDATVTPPLPEKRREESIASSTSVPTPRHQPERQSASLKDPDNPRTAKAIAELKRASIEPETAVLERWITDATDAQITKAISEARQQKGPTPCSIGFADSILKRLLAEDRKAREAADAKLASTHAQVEEQRTWQPAPMPEALRPKRPSSFEDLKP